MQHYSSKFLRSSARRFLLARRTSPLTMVKLQMQHVSKKHLKNRARSKYNVYYIYKQPIDANFGPYSFNPQRRFFDNSAKPNESTLHRCLKFRTDPFNHYLLLKLISAWIDPLYLLTVFTIVSTTILRRYSMCLAKQRF